MTTLRDIFTTFGPEYLERYPHLPTAHRQVISAIQHCQSGHYGYSLYACPTCAGQHRVNHSCGNRHCPQCQQHKTQQWLQDHLDKQLPGPHFLMTFTVPEALRPFIRSHQRPAYQAMFHASATALKRLAHDERFIGTDLLGCTGVLHKVGPASAPGKPGSLGKEKVAISWKFDFETQRVKVPSSQSLASRLEASLAPCWGDPLGEA